MRLFQEVLQREKGGPALPEGSLAKLEAMREDRDAAISRVRSISEKIKEAMRVRRAIEKEKGDLTGEWAMGNLQRRTPTGRGGYTLTNGHDTLTQIDEALEKQNAEIAALRAKEEAASKASQAVFGPLQAIEDWIEDYAGAEFKTFDATPKMKRKASEDWSATAKRLRDEVAELQAERHRVASAPIPADEAKAAMRREIEALAEAGMPDVGRCLEGHSIRWPTKKLLGANGGLLVFDFLDVQALVAWLDRDRLIARLEDEIDAMADPAEALTDAQRQKEDARLRAEVLRVEREEEAAISAAAAEGTTIPRRRNADPRAVLELASNVPGHEERF